MIHPNDEQSLLRMLGTDTLPKAVRDECELRTKMYHRDGNSGAMRSLALIDLLRYLKLKPVALEASPDKIDWRKYPQDGSVRIEAKYFGEWQPGKFLGFVEHGMLAIRLDGDAMVRESRPDNVRLLEVQSLSDEQDKPDARALLLESTEKAKAVVEPDADDVPDEEYDEPEEATGGDGWWLNAKSGAKVWVNVNDDVIDGVLVAQELSGDPGDELRLIVEHDGKRHSYHPDLVQLVR